MNFVDTFFPLLRCLGPSIDCIFGMKARPSQGMHIPPFHPRIVGMHASGQPVFAQDAGYTSPADYVRSPPYKANIADFQVKISEGGV